MSLFESCRTWLSKAAEEANFAFWYAEEQDNFDEIYHKVGPQWMNLGLRSAGEDQQAFAAKVRRDCDAIKQRQGGFPDSPDYLKACENLAKRMYEAATPLGSDAQVLDVGCGWGDQALLYRSLNPNGAKYTGINIGSDQVRAAALRTAHLQNVTISEGSATDLTQYDAGQFTQCFALECAFHFNTRAKFFSEANRVLSPGGELVLMDMIWSHEVETKYLGPWYTIMAMLHALVQGIPARQFPLNSEVSIATYKKSLEGCGFEDVQIQNISDEIYMWRDWIAQAEAFLPRWTYRNLWECIRSPWSNNPFMNLGFHFSKGRSSAAIQYVLVTAKKPKNADALA